MNNNERYDLSNRLIHFFRDVERIDLDKLPSFIENPTTFENQKKDAFFFLEQSIRYKLLPTTWSQRENSGNCIYGSTPAICFTEMPIPAFIDTVEYRRTKKEKISIYGLIFKKNDLYKLGARQVIYGLSGGIDYNLITDETGQKKLEENIIPEKELYRYVPYHPFDENFDNGVDFSHEREWRLPIIVDNGVEDDREFYSCKKTEGAINSLPNLKIRKRFVSDIGIIVEIEEDREKIIKILKETYQDKEYCPYTYIIVKKSICDIKVLYDFNKLEEFIEKSKKDFKKSFKDNK